MHKRAVCVYIQYSVQANDLGEKLNNAGHFS